MLNEADDWLGMFNCPLVYELSQAMFHIVPRLSENTIFTSGRLKVYLLRFVDSPVRYYVSKTKNDFCQQRTCFAQRLSE